MPALAQKLAIEGLGTALLVFTVAVSVGQGAGLVAVSIGSTLMCAIYGACAAVVMSHASTMHPHLVITLHELAGPD